MDLSKPDLDMQIAEKFFGWRWVRTHGIPVKSHPLYSAPETRSHGIPVRIFCNDSVGEAATGDEALSYDYSSGYYPQWPRPTSDIEALEELEKELRIRKLTNELLYRLTLVERTAAEKRHPWRPSPRMICVAALAAIEEQGCEVAK